MTLPQFYDTEIVRSEKLNGNTTLIELKLPEDANFEFKAGQFVLIYRDIDGKEVNRAFSIASKPSQKNIELLIRKYEQGKVSPYLFELKEGDKLKIRGPFGVFNVKEPLEKEVVFVASGTGIAPLRSMIGEIFEKFPENKVTLIFGFRYDNDFFFRDEIEGLVENNENFKLHLCATKAESLECLKGRVTEHLPGIVGTDKNKQFYICGPNQMINDTLNMLIKDIGFEKEKVIIERWGSG